MGQAENFRRAKSGVLACVFIRPHWGPEYTKFAAVAVYELRLALPGQRFWPVFHCKGGYQPPEKPSPSKGEGAPEGSG